MPTIKVSEATGTTLDWLVAKCEGATDEWRSDGPFFWHGVPCIRDDGHDVDFRPSTDWAEGGPIIEREHISLESPSTLLTAFWQADIGHAHKFTQWDHKPLLAAMRCYVASKLGDEVEVPEGLS